MIRKLDPDQQLTLTVDGRVLDCEQSWVLPQVKSRGFYTWSLCLRADPDRAPEDTEPVPVFLVRGQDDSAHALVYIISQVREHFRTSPRSYQILQF
jgi:hypothetical protein